MADARILADLIQLSYAYDVAAQARDVVHLSKGQMLTVTALEDDGVFALDGVRLPA